jgi:putative PIN family toxin of toxin-antitoxin system
MKILLDTNVLIAALVAQGVCAELLEHCVLRHTLLSSDPILAELQEQLAKKLQYGAEDLAEAAALLRAQMEMVNPVEINHAVCRDPEDDMVLATAVAAKADCIVTGDKDLLVLRRYEEVEILSPSEFATFEARQSR